MFNFIKEILLFGRIRAANSILEADLKDNVLSQEKINEIIDSFNYPAVPPIQDSESLEVPCPQDKPEDYETSDFWGESPYFAGAVEFIEANRRPRFVSGSLDMVDTEPVFHNIESQSNSVPFYPELSQEEVEAINHFMEEAKNNSSNPQPLILSTETDPLEKRWFSLNDVNPFSPEMIEQAVETIRNISQSVYVISKYSNEEDLFEEEEPEIPEMVMHPDHYGGEDNPYEAIKVIEAWGLGFNLSTVLRYIRRSPEKFDYIEDLKKAKFYLEREIDTAIRIKNGYTGTNGFEHGDLFHLTVRDGQPWMERLSEEDKDLIDNFDEKEYFEARAKMQRLNKLFVEKMRYMTEDS